MVPAPARHRAFTLIELIVVIAVIGVLAAVALHRLTVYQELAEKTAMESTLSTIKTGLQIRLAELIIANRQSDAKQLENGNPMQWLAEPPANYGGVYPGRAEEGNWYYDERQHELVYVVHTGEFLTIEAAVDGKQLRFRTKVLRSYIENRGAKIESVTGVTLVPVYHYHWP